MPLFGQLFRSLVVLVCLLWFAISASAAKEPTFNFGVNVSHWLSQLGPNMKYGDAEWFNADDVRWIASQGFDHLRVPVDGRLLLDMEGKADPTRLAPLDRLLRWCGEHGLGVVLDMHFLPGSDSSRSGDDHRLFVDAELQAQAVEIWKAVALHFKSVGTQLRFELINEPVADYPSELNKVNRLLLEGVREVSPKRICYLTSNLWSVFETARYAYVPPDPNIMFTFHYYEPFIFTHQQTPWTDVGENYMNPVEFPARIGDLSPHFPDGHWIVKRYSDRDFTEEQISADFLNMGRWAKEHKVHVYVGEFGVHRIADARSISNWVRAVRKAARDNEISWAVWDYKGKFGIRDQMGGPTAVLEALTKPLPPE